MASSLKFLSYNIQVGIETRSCLSRAANVWRHVLPDPQRLETLKKMAAIARHFDVVAIQESDCGSARSCDLTAALGEISGHLFMLTGKNRDIAGIARHGLGLLSRFPFIEARMEGLPSPIPGRGIMIVKIAAPSGLITVCNTHLSLSRRTRQAQARYIGGLLRQEEVSVLMGDFNCSAESREMLEIRDAGAFHIEQTAPTYPSWNPRRDIDHVLVSRDFPVLSQGPLSHVVSDHLPVYAEVCV